MENDEKMKMLFDEHHKHLSEIKQKVQGLAQRTITLLALATGWLILAKNPPPAHLKVILVLAFILIGISSINALYRFNKNYRAESKMIANLNDYFNFFEKGHYFDGKSIYPESWKKFGEQSVWYGLGHHIVPILVMTLLAIVAAIAR